MCLLLCWNYAFACRNDIAMCFCMLTPVYGSFYICYIQRRRTTQFSFKFRCGRGWEFSMPGFIFYVAFVRIRTCKHTHTHSQNSNRHYKYLIWHPKILIYDTCLRHTATMTECCAITILIVVAHGARGVSIIYKTAK